MTGKKSIRIAILFVLTAAHSLYAQQSDSVKEEKLQRLATQTARAESDSKPAIFYRLDFAIRELNGEKLVDTRNYSLWVQSGVSERMTAGSEVPYLSGSYSTSASGTAKNISYRNVGVSIDCFVKEGIDNPSIDLVINISDALPPEKDLDSPVIRKVTLNSRAMLALGKPTTVSIVEDPGSRHRYQVDVTATKLK